MSESRRSGAWGEAYQALGEELGRWIHNAIRRNEPIPFQGGHDECNYTQVWPAYSAITGDEQPMQFCRALRDQLLAWPELYHGFYPNADWDIEHSVENWTVFMRAMAEADPGDEVTASGIEDLVHHLGNWADGCPAWFDWDRRRFVSEYVGTRAVKDLPPYDFSTYWDARAAELALAYYDLRGDERYLQFCVAFAGGWADHILAQEGLGYWLMLDADIADREGFKAAYGEYPEDFHARNIGWAQEIMAHMLHVHARVPDQSLLDAARKIATIGPEAVARFRGEEVSTTPWRRTYQAEGGDQVFADEVAAADRELVSNATAALELPLPDILMLEGTGHYPARRYAWRDEAGVVREHTGPSPSQMWEAFRLSGEERLAVRAMELVARQLKLAASTLRDGREHGCNGRFVHGAAHEAMRVFEKAG